MMLRAVLATCLFAAGVRAAEPTFSVDLGSGVVLDLILIHAGEFTQGSPEQEAGRGTDEIQHHVRLTHDYYLARTAVTRAQWQRFATETGYRTEAESGASGGFGWNGTALSQSKQFNWKHPGFAQADDHPACLVTFADALAFCKWLSEKAHRKVDLPTEAEWEYACRAGTTSAWHAGDSPSDGNRVTWHKGNSGNSTHPAGSRPANPWGLVIGGNVSEWCLDWYAPYSADNASNPLQSNPNLSDKPRRVLRGGSWLRDVKNTRSAARYRADPQSRNADIGFRIACAADLSIPPTAIRTIAPVSTPAAPAPLADSLGTPVFPPANQELAPPSPLPQQVPGNWAMRGLLALLCPFAAILAIIILVLRKKTASSSITPGMMAPPVMPSGMLHGCRFLPVDDGFWIHSDCPIGTPLALSYLTGGIARTHTVVYRPGPQGHFIYTGSRPDQISANPLADTQGNDIPPPLPPEPDTTWHNQNQSSGFSNPPTNPPAY